MALIFMGSNKPFALIDTVQKEEDKDWAQFAVGKAKTTVGIKRRKVIMIAVNGESKEEGECEVKGE